jgi:hypothetical protein
VAFGILGIILLAAPERTARQQKPQQSTFVRPRKAALNKRLESIAWGFFWSDRRFYVHPDKVVTKGWWSIGVGLIMLRVELSTLPQPYQNERLHYLAGYSGRRRWCGAALHHRRYRSALLLIILGLYLIFKQWFDQRKLFGKAEEA